MSKKLTEGCFLYQTGMEGIGNLNSILRSSTQTLFKDIYVNGVGIKKIDKIDDDVITFNQGYKAIDDYVIYEIYNDEASVLTTVKKIDANNFKCSEDISAIKGVATMRIPPLGLEYAGKSASGNSDIYLNKHGNAFLITNDGYVFAQKTKDSITSPVNDALAGDVILVSSYEIILPHGDYAGIATDGSPVRSYYTASNFQVIYDEISHDDKRDSYLFPASPNNAGAGVGVSRVPDSIGTQSTVFSNVFVGKNRSMLRSLLSSSSNSEVKDFYIPSESRVIFLHHDDNVIALSVQNSSAETGLAVKLARIES